jgi:diguanylate cyclase (GGDEF)-like protein
MTALTTRERTDYAALGDRMTYLLGLRVAFAAITLLFAVQAPSVLAVPVDRLLGATGAYLLVAVVLEALGRRIPAFAFPALTVMLLVDGVYLAVSMYATGGTESPMRFLAYLHVVAVSLLASYRTGLKIALWHSLLLFVVLYAQAAGLLAPVDVAPGAEIALDGMPVIHVTAFWLFALATSLFSATNERELRQRRADLEALVGLGARLDDETDPERQATLVLDTLAARHRFPRGLVLVATDGGLALLASRGLDPAASAERVPPATLVADPIVGRAWAERVPLALRRLDPRREPTLAGLLPGGRDVIVAPMIADGEPAGVIVLEHRGRAVLGIERRVIDAVAQAAAIAALNFRNAVLMRHVQDLAERDALTGAANRRSFQASLERVLETGGGGRDRATAVLFVDLDDFKVVNDTLGHAAGDALLVAVTQRITGLVREGDLVARLGGDEFAILLQDHPDLRRSLVMADRLVRELGAPYLIGGKRVVVTASIGIAGARDAVDGATDMVRNADVAMYMAKANGKAAFAVFDPGMHAVIRERHELALELQRAVELDQLELRYQPIVELATGRLAGVEALVRWRHPERGLIPPGQFIELAEEHGSILPIGRWVLGEACRQAVTWRRSGLTPDDLFVSVNVSAREVQEAGFVDGVRATIEEHGVAASTLVIEITETALLRATPSTIGALDGLRAMGVRVVIDDFGTGYFSLSHLRQFPVDALKIAGEFTQDAESPSRSSALAAAIVAMARSMGIDTVAEGIETARQAEWMRSLECRYGQGFFFAKPLLAAELAEATVAAREAALEAARQPAPAARGVARTTRRARGLARAADGA